MAKKKRDMNKSNRLAREAIKRDKSKRVVSTPTRKGKPSAPVKQTELRDAPTLAAFSKWKDEGVPVKNLVGDLKTSEFTLRMRFINIAGGREAFDALRKNGAGGRVFGGKKPTPRTRETVVLDDAKVLHIKGKDVRAIRSPLVVKHMEQVLTTIDRQIDQAKGKMERYVLQATKDNALAVVDAGRRDAKHKGWTALSLPRQNGYELHLIKPDGQQFIRAGAMERADVVVDGDDGATRWRSVTTASRVKVERAVEAETTKRVKAKQQEKAKSKQPTKTAKKKRK